MLRVKKYLEKICRETRSIINVLIGKIKIGGGYEHEGHTYVEKKDIEENILYHLILK